MLIVGLKQIILSSVRRKQLLVLLVAAVLIFLATKRHSLWTENDPGSVEPKATDRKPEEGAVGADVSRGGHKDGTHQQAAFNASALQASKERLKQPGSGPAIAENKPHGAEPTKEVHHLFFLKVHKAASTTVLNVIYRFALSRHLVVVLPVGLRTNVLSERSKVWTRYVAPLPPGADHFDVLCNHLIFDETSIRRALPKDSLFVGIVRQPFDQFVSAFWYYREKYNYSYLKKIPGSRPISTYLRNPKLWEPKETQFITSRMSIDFGMDPARVHDTVYVNQYVKYLNDTFHLVMVSDRFDESILLMRRLLGWRVRDVIYIKNNARTTFYNQTFTSKEKRTHRDWNPADYALYEHFARVLDDKVRDAGQVFRQEVESFRVIRQAVRDYCRGNSTHTPLKVQATLWAEEFSVTKEMCDLMTMDEIPFVNLMRRVNGKKHN